MTLLADLGGNSSQPFLTGLQVVMGGVTCDTRLGSENFYRLLVGSTMEQEERS
jgi:hypothetical protein